MQPKGKRLFSLPLLTLLLALTTVIAFAAREWVENGTLIIYPGAENLMTQYDEVTVQYEYSFVEEPGVASAKLIGYTNDTCGGGNDRWGGVPVSAAATWQATELDGFAKLVMSPDAALLTPDIQSVTVEIRLQETNHQMVNRVDFYCRVVDHAATEAAAEVPDNEPSLGEITSNHPVTLNAIEPGYLLLADTGMRFGTLTDGSNVSADISYKFKNAPGEFRFVMISSRRSCHARHFQEPTGTPQDWVDVSAEITRQPGQMENRETFNLTIDTIPDGYRSITLKAQTWENGESTGALWAGSCFNVEDHTIDLLTIDPGFVLDEERNEIRLGGIAPNATVTAGMLFTFEDTPGNVEVRLMGLDVPCHRWLYNLNAPPIPTDSYPVSNAVAESFTQLENTTTLSLLADQMRPSTKGVYLEARAFENGVEIEHNVFLSCSDVNR